MSMAWGPAVDAEINYRREQARRDAEISYRRQQVRPDFGRTIFHLKSRVQRDSSPRNPIHRAAI